MTQAPPPVTPSTPYPVQRGGAPWVPALETALAEVIIGQRELVHGLLIGLLTGGHVLLEGVPGLAKSLAVSTLAKATHGSFARLQFTPDLLPSDLVGTEIYNAKESTFTTRKGPIFANFVLADEVNRAPAKVQSALLEAMQEHQVSIGGVTFKLPEPFLVLATQNPLEQEGTYALPEAQVDRFALKLVVDYPSKEEELLVLHRMARTSPPLDVRQVVSLEEIQRARSAVDQVTLDPKLAEYIVALVQATRQPAAAGLKDLVGRVQYGASPRATIWLALAARANAFLEGRAFATPADIKRVAPPVLRHRVIPTYEADAEGLSSDKLVARLLETIPVP
ncbi:MAG: MoxR family ATPase [Planctomycetes bacterium]|jgi:MoxR-like ATPase|nr:MoxR family ATPase [Planctomycetota bacterium]